MFGRVEEGHVALELLKRDCVHVGLNLEWPHVMVFYIFFQTYIYIIYIQHTHIYIYLYIVFSLGCMCTGKYIYIHTILSFMYSYVHI